MPLTAAEKQRRYRARRRERELLADAGRRAVTVVVDVTSIERLVEAEVLPPELVEQDEDLGRAISGLVDVLAQDDVAPIVARYLEELALALPVTRACESER